MLKLLRPVTSFLEKDFVRHISTNSPQIQFSGPVKASNRESELLLELVDSSKKITGKRKPLIKQWIGDGFKPGKVTKSYLGFLLHVASQERNTEYLMALLSTINTSRLELTEPHYNAMLLSMDAHGWHDMVKTNFREDEAKQM